MGDIEEFIESLQSQPNDLVVPDGYSFFGKKLTLWKADPSMTNTYSLGKKIGSGSYGIVYKGKHRETQTRVAIKHFKTKSECDDTERKNIIIGKSLPSDMVKEIEFMINASCPYVSPLYDVVVPIKAIKDPPANVFMISELARFDLCELTKKFKPDAKPRTHFDTKYIELFIRYIMFSMASAISFCTSKGIIHCDIKPSNTLAFDNGAIKITDFGISKRIPIPDGYGVYDHHVMYLVSLWYRAPELVFYFSHFTAKIDVWAMGASCYQVLTGKALFPAESQVDLAEKMVKILGAPTKNKFPELHQSTWLNAPLSQQYIDIISTKSISVLTKMLKKYSISSDCIRLIKQTLTWDPESRISAHDVVQNQYFEQLRSDPILHQYFMHKMLNVIKDPSEETIAEVLKFNIDDERVLTHDSLNPL